MKPTQSLDGQNLPLVQHLCRPGNCLRGVFVLPVSLCIGQKNPGATNRAGIGLGMKTTIQGIVVFLLAILAHDKPFHGCLGPVIGNIFNNGVPRAAIGTIDKGIFKSSVLWVIHLRQTRFTNTDIGRNQGIAKVALPAFNNLKTRKLLDRHLLGFNPGDKGKQGRFFTNVPDKTVHRSTGSLHQDEHPLGRIRHLPEKMMGMGQTKQKRPETNTLNHPADLKSF